MAERPEPLRRPALDPRHRAVYHPEALEDLPGLRFRLFEAVLGGVVRGGRGRAALPHQGAVRLHRTPQRGSAHRPGGAGTAHPGGRAERPGAPGQSHSGHRRPGHLRREPGREHRRHDGAGAELSALDARRPHPSGGQDADALPAELRRRGQADAAGVQYLQALHPHHPEPRVRREQRGGHRHPAGRPHLR